MNRGMLGLLAAAALASAGCVTQRIAVSKDGRVAVAGSGTLYVFDRDGLLVETATQPQHAFWPVWSPDGTRVLFCGGSKEEWEHCRTLYILDVASGAVTTLFDLESEKTGDDWDMHLWCPQWCPDGQRISFTVYDDRQEWSQLRIMNLGTKAMTVLTEGVAPFHAWSPDGKRIVFSRAARKSALEDLVPSDLVVADVASGGEEVHAAVLFDAHFYAEWTPDGREIFFQTSRVSIPHAKKSEKQRQHIFRLDPASQKIEEVCGSVDPEVDESIWFTLSPNGSSLAIFVSNDKKDEAFLFARTNGKLDPTGRFLMKKGSLSLPAWLDDRRILYTSLLELRVIDTTRKENFDSLFVQGPAEAAAEEEKLPPGLSSSEAGELRDLLLKWRSLAIVIALYRIQEAKAPQLAHKREAAERERKDVAEKLKRCLRKVQEDAERVQKWAKELQDRVDR